MSVNGVSRAHKLTEETTCFNIEEIPKPLFSQQEFLLT